jgi:NAD(P)-dependent dehydrogenase (short-subunit alcohol dehydrogenase family)
MGRRKYRSWGAYGQSKLANLLFTAELQRRLDANAISIHAMAAHPGYAATNLQAVGPELSGRSWLRQPFELLNRIVAQSAAMGALPTLFAATAPGLPGDSYVGPDGFMEQRGHPRLVDRSAAAKSRVDARRLWDESERLTGVTYPLEIS